MAGYDEPMNDMIRENSGTQRRFQHTFNFLPWDADDCWSYIYDRAQKDGYDLDPQGDLMRELHDCFNTLIQRPGWGNGGDAEAAYGRLRKARAVRLRDAGIKREDPMRFTHADALKAKEESLKHRPAGPSKTDLLRGIDGEEGEMRALTLTSEQKRQTQKQKQRNKHKVRETDDAEDDGGHGGDGGAGAGAGREPAHEALKATHEEEEQRAAALSQQERDRYEAEKAEAKARFEALELERARLAQEAREAEEKRQAALKAEREAIAKAKAARDAAEKAAAEKAAEAAKEAAAAAQAAAERAAEEAKAREQERKLEKLKCMGPCPAGFTWTKRGSYYYCGGGSHVKHENDPFFC